MQKGAGLSGVSLGRLVCEGACVHVSTLTARLEVQKGAGISGVSLDRLV